MIKKSIYLSLNKMGEIICIIIWLIKEKLF